jgi:hypothetical protein
MAELFQTDRTSLVKHIKNIYKSGELSEETTCAKIAQVQKEGKRTIKRNIDHYNLDLIISVGYRVNSLRGTQFRIWAGGVLKDYLTKGYAIDKRRLQEQSRQLEELKQTVKLLGSVVELKPLNSDEATGLLRVITDYTYALDVLDRYDHQVLEIVETTRRELFRITYQEAIKAIKGLKEKFGGSPLFGNEKDESFPGSLAAIYQTFGGRDLYPAWKRRQRTCSTL